MTANKQYALIVAGGKGLRMGSDVPKQFMLLKGKPVLMHTMEKFAEAGCEELIVVLPEAQIVQWERLCKQHAFVIPHCTTAGGKERFDSVKNGLALVGDDGYVAIHDGVRPCIPVDLIHRCFDDARQYGCAIAAVKSKDSLRMEQGDQTIAVNRELFHLVQTPQVFGVESIKKVYEQPFNKQFTDDASVYEAAGNTIHITPGDYRNIKITTTEDLVLAESFL